MRYTLAFDTLDIRIVPSAIVITGGTPRAPVELAAIDPTEPVYTPPSEPGNPIIIAPTSAPDPFAPVVA